MIRSTTPAGRLQWDAVLSQFPTSQVAGPFSRSYSYLAYTHNTQHLTVHILCLERLLENLGPFSSVKPFSSFDTLLHLTVLVLDACNSKHRQCAI